MYEFDVEHVHLLEEDIHGSDQTSRDQVLVYDDSFHLTELWQVDCIYCRQHSIDFCLLSKAIQHVGGHRCGCAGDELLGFLDLPVIAISGGNVSSMRLNILDTVDATYAMSEVLDDVAGST